MGKKILIDVTERGRNGGKARAASMSKAALSDAARKAVNKRWADVRALAAAKQAKVVKRLVARLRTGSALARGHS
jgi:hypothetical protein